MEFSRSVSAKTRHSRVVHPTNDKVDKAVIAWFQTMRSQGMEISGMMLQVKAAEFNKALGGPETFTASNGWLEKFLHRHGIRTLTVCGEKQEADFKGAEEYVPLHCNAD